MIKEIINRICLVVHWIGFILIPIGFYTLDFGKGFDGFGAGLTLGLTLVSPFLFCWLVRFILTGRKRLVPWE